MLGRSMGMRLASLAMLVAGFGAAAGHVQPTPIVAVANAPRSAKRGLFGGARWAMSSLYGRKGAGISMAQQQRASKKRRNQARHKAVRRG